MKIVKCKNCDSVLDIDSIEPTTLITKIRCFDKEYYQLDVECPKCNKLISVNYEDYKELYRFNKDLASDRLLEEIK